jgi:hypothetical protein
VVEELNSYVAYVSRRLMNSRYTKFGWNRLRGYRVNLDHTDRQTDIHSLLFIRQDIDFFKGNMNSYVAYVCRRVLNSRYTKFGWNRLRG